MSKTARILDKLCTFAYWVLIFAAVLYLLSKVFQYGQELQTLSDETL